MGKIFKIIINFLLVLTILILASYFALRITNRIKIYNVETGSMEDKIHAGDYLLLCRKSKYYIGDVVTYQVNGYFVTHRIVSIDDDKIITKGDANNKEDDEINISQIEGKAIYWGGVLNFIINYKYVLVAILIALYLISCYFDKDEESEEQQKNIEKIENEEAKEEIEQEDEGIDVLETETSENVENKEVETINEEQLEIIEEIKENQKSKTKKTKKKEEIAIIKTETTQNIENKEIEVINEDIKEDTVEEIKEVQKPKAKSTKKKENIETKEEIKEPKTTKRKSKKDK